MVKFDLTKPVELANGTPARIICTDRKHPDEPIIALISDSHGKETVKTYTAEGHSPYPGYDDLVNVREEFAYRVNIYRYKDGRVWAGTPVPSGRALPFETSSGAECIAIASFTVKEGDGLKE
jgi:hypothetical protein